MASGAIVRDPELTAMSRIKKELDALTPEVRKRVFAWISEREQTQPAEPQTKTPVANAGAKAAT